MKRGNLSRLFRLIAVCRMAQPSSTGRGVLLAHIRFGTARDWTFGGISSETVPRTFPKSGQKEGETFTDLNGGSTKTSDRFGAKHTGMAARCMASSANGTIGGSPWIPQILGPRPTCLKTAIRICGATRFFAAAVSEAG